MKVKRIGILAERRGPLGPITLSRVTLLATGGQWVEVGHPGGSASFPLADEQLARDYYAAVDGPRDADGFLVGFRS